MPFLVAVPPELADMTGRRFAGILFLFFTTGLGVHARACAAKTLDGWPNRLAAKLANAANAFQVCQFPRPCDQSTLSQDLFVFLALTDGQRKSGSMASAACSRATTGRYEPAARTTETGGDSAFWGHCGSDRLHAQTGRALNSAVWIAPAATPHCCLPIFR